LFILVGALQERLHTRDMRQLGGLWSRAPRIGAIGLFFAIASLGLPGLGNFVGEFLVLFGTYRVASGFAIAATLGLVVSTIYALSFVQRVFHGEHRTSTALTDFSSRHMLVMATMIVALVWLGCYPQPVFDTASSALANLQRVASDRQSHVGEP
jgi:NADH-quinone oxidoreductase subunit M